MLTLYIYGIFKLLFYDISIAIYIIVKSCYIHNYACSTVHLRLWEAFFTEKLCFLFYWTLMDDQITIWTLFIYHIVIWSCIDITTIAHKQRALMFIHACVDLFIATTTNEKFTWNFESFTPGLPENLTFFCVTYTMVSVLKWSHNTIFLVEYLCHINLIFYTFMCLTV